MKNALILISLLLTISLFSNVNAATAAWNPPTEWTNGDPLNPADIQNYKIYGSTTQGGPYELLTTIPGTENTAQITLTPATWYIVVTATANDIESAYSNEAKREPLIPGTPLNLHFVINGTIQLQVQ